ncbi:unnamed protein product [Phaedon cochleariae]|uniref:Uncharacterized protein n=1 Tax=Phaedon cochleariae TaxID=80249 RepID=A0A9N9X2E3_PHACE|nr:unnamed protein product [Phaedon cochleariae]
MRILEAWLPVFIIGATLFIQIESRRVRIERPEVEEEEQEETVNYYSAEPQEDQRTVVLVSSADRYNGLYGQQQASARSIENNYIPRGQARPQLESTRAKEPNRPPPVQTLRNYNKVNDDGSFTFGYEAADGSFKEETRGTDCVVRGKYGYVDPDGNKREFTYVSGNPCDPNAPQDQDDPEESQEAQNENVPQNYPTRPIQALRRPVPKPAVTLFQNTYAQEEEQPEDVQVLRPTPQPVRRPTYISRPQYVQQTSADEVSPQVYRRPQVAHTTTPAPAIYRSSVHPVTITPRPVTPTVTSRPSQLPATTYRPQLFSVTPRPTPILYTKQLQASLSSTLSPNRDVDFDEEFQRFQQENNLVSPTPTSLTARATSPRPQTTPNNQLSNPPHQVYSTQLVFDPATGQYTNQIYQSLPQTEGGDYALKQRIQPYVQRAKPQVLNIQQLQQQSPLYTQSLRPQPVHSQATYQAQQAEQQFQNSAQLFAQQQRARAQQAQQTQQDQQDQQEQQRQPARQQVYYVQPTLDSTGALATSQIDAFLRGHNIQF